MSQFRVDGMAGLEKALADLAKSQSKAVSRRALIEAAEPTVTAAEALAPVDDGELRESIGASNKLTPRQKRRFRETRGDVTVFVGAGASHAHLVEFGTKAHTNAGQFAGSQHPGTSAQPFMRPAWEGTKHQVLERLKDRLWANIEKTVARNAARAAKASKKGK